MLSRLALALTRWAKGYAATCLPLRLCEHTAVYLAARDTTLTAFHVPAAWHDIFFAWFSAHLALEGVMIRLDGNGTGHLTSSTSRKYGTVYFRTSLSVTV